MVLNKRVRKLAVEMGMDRPDMLKEAQLAMLNMKQKRLETSPLIMRMIPSRTERGMFVLFNNMDTLF